MSATADPRPDPSATPSPHAAPPAAPALPPHALGYRALKLWQRALDLAADAHTLARALPEADQPALAADLRRAAASVPATIATSALALDAAAQQHALHATTAALGRLETLAALAERLGSLPHADATALLFTAGDVNRLLRGFARSVAARSTAPATPRPTPPADPAPPPALAVAERAAADPAPADAPAPVVPAPPSMRTGRRRAARATPEP